MSGNSSFGSFFGGTMGVLFALIFFFIGLPILICGGCFGVAIIGSANVDRDVAAPRITAPVNPSDDTHPSDDTETRAVDDKPDATTASVASESEPSVHKMGDTVTVGYTSYKVWRLWWSEQLSANEFLNQPPDASYLFVELSIRNNDKTARAIPPIYLLDENGAKYQASPNGWAVEGSIGVLDSLNPGVSKQGFVVFDVPKDHSYKLKISGGYWSAEDALIELVDSEREAAAAAAESRAELDEARRIEADQNRAMELAREEEIESRKWRVWVSAGGAHRTEAKFKSAGNGRVTLEKKDGTTLVVQLELLSAEDQEFITKRKWLNE